jgi:hypothetical protein
MGGQLLMKARVTGDSSLGLAQKHLGQQLSTAQCLTGSVVQHLGNAEPVLIVSWD